ncbi:tRNA (adenosine(37)-N6)-threonylcarbamoyltransferase complex dimerization subunit type 1 TsaB [Prosthecomicrobium sp. N25]|uniref:tRNA (adenosine(37)-N6)-threonylcarbamoyltransferase complex dimerization subunit type 1 TsaB n=1 Tax=Prosthecomicrobium sp. N25 TaxID=3129254 RepID=UPI00307876D5
MLTLALDTALDACAVALLRDGRILAAVTRDIGRGHAEVLMAVVAEALAAAGGLRIKDCDRFGVTVGPGSFTGIRVGLAAARGFGLAAGRPVVPVTTLEAIAADAAGSTDPQAPILVALDARRGEVYAGLFAAAPGSEPVPLSAPAALPLAEAAALAVRAGAVLAGSGAALVAAAAPSPLRILGEARYPRVETVARLAAARPAPGRPPGPVYLRAADAKPQEGFRIPRAPEAGAPAHARP